MDYSCQKAEVSFIEEDTTILETWMTHIPRKDELIRIGETIYAILTLLWVIVDDDFYITVYVKAEQKVSNEA